ncbi:M20/M25/M40 family metallo-hydrolase [Wukongibacter sp. M2B1]|uniref:M20/M25/M40 family metallo-hydrolase n=1 Tax=Wukongibacter sp. M2B1 TaxID=3088895 RepID=UPI003D792F19
MRSEILKGIDEEIERIFYPFIQIRSDTFSRHEKKIEEFLTNFFANIDYFKRYPEHFGTYKIENDPINRSVCWALVRGEGEETVVLIHHNDVVDIEDFKTLKPYAYSPKELERELVKLKKDLLSEARKDLESGEYIFGRGTADMKSGGAIQLALIKRYSEIEDFKGNVLLVSVPDEENLSAGMRSAILLLEELKKKYRLRYLMMINSEPHQRVHKDIGIISEGSVGKIMPLVYVRGSLAHIGKVFEGFNPLSLLTEIVRRTELNIEFSDFVEGEGSPPPTWLYIKDRKYHYDVSMPLGIGGCFSVLTLDSSPAVLLEKLKNISEEAFSDIIERMNDTYRSFRERVKRPFEVLPWKVNVITFEELYNEAYENYGESFKRCYDKTFEEISKKIEAEELSIVESNFLLIEMIFDYINDLSPRVVIALVPPYYPNVSNIYFEELDQRAKGISVKLIDYARKNFSQSYAREYFYTGISDLSYSSVKNSKEIVKSLEGNMPLYGPLYSIPLEKIEELSMPCINIGPWGKDFHKLTERVLKEDLFHITPRLLDYAITTLLGCND